MGQASDSVRDSSSASNAPRLIDRFRATIRSRHYSPRTEKSYWFWIRYFIFHNKKRHPAEMGAPEVTAFPSWPATDRNVAAATQNQALAALLFLSFCTITYRKVRGIARPSGRKHHNDLHLPAVQRWSWRARRSQEQGPHLWGCDGEGARYDCGIIPTRSASSAVAPTG